MFSLCFLPDIERIFHSMKDIQKGDTDTHTHILEVQSCHHTKRNQTNNKNMLTCYVKIDIRNIYKEKKMK